MQTPLARALGILRNKLGPLMRKRTYGSLFTLGVLNGFLPCGMVYVAGVGAVAVGGLGSGILYMLAFGLGTVPVMLAIGLAGKFVHFGLRLKFQRLIPVTLAIVATLLIMRGLALGIPYVSPALAADRSCCH
jgi:sulfite exporter TauE/SafE